MKKKIPLEKQGYYYIYNNKCHCNNIEQLHLICEKCGNIEHLKTKAISIIEKEALEEDNFNLDIGKLSFYGICKECRR